MTAIWLATLCGLLVRYVRTHLDSFLPPPRAK